MTRPAFIALEQARGIASRWAEGGGPEQAQRELTALFEAWQPTDSEDKAAYAARQALEALQRAYNDWLQRGENCEELLHQLLWILDPAHSGVMPDARRSAGAADSVGRP